MKIICTQYEKEHLIKTMGDTDNWMCPFEKTNGTHCPREGTCEDCIRSKFEWEIIDGGKDD